MAFREVTVVQVKEVLRRWLRGEGERTIAKGVGVDRFKVAKPLHVSYDAFPVNANPKELDTLVELDLPADSSGVERTIELIPSK